MLMGVGTVKKKKYINLFINPRSYSVCLPFQIFFLREIKPLAGQHIMNLLISSSQLCLFYHLSFFFSSSPSSFPSSSLPPKYFPCVYLWLLQALM